MLSMRAKRLIGADGVHSRTRTYVCDREIKPNYSGQFMIAAYITRSKVQYGPRFRIAEENREIALSATTSQGTLMIIPADPHAAPIQIGRQWPGPERDRQGWEAMAADKDAMFKLFVEDKDEWSDLPRNILDVVQKEDMWGVWAFYLLPKLDQWISKGGRMVIIGDAAHALIPAAAQGANQAVEDAWTLAKAYGSFVGSNTTEIKGLQIWEEKRRAKLEKVAQLSVQLMNARLPPEEQAKLPPDMVFDFMTDEEEGLRRFDWLYGKQDVDSIRPRMC